MADSAHAPWPCYTQEEIDAVARVLASGRVNYWTGEEGRAFEAEFASWVGVRHAVAAANGTVALELALRALGIGPGDEVVVTPRSFVASASCVVAVGARPVFADVDADSGNLTAASVEAVLTSRTRAVVAVHLGGWPCEMDGILALAGEHGLLVVEDCAQAHGARYRGRSVGAIGHVAAWSFCQDKIMTTGGEGGMITTDDSELFSRLWSLKDHGKDRAAVQDQNHPPGFRWLHESFGTNARMTEMQAAIGRIQLRRMAHWQAARAANAEALAAALEPVSGPEGPLRVPALRCGACTSGARDCACRHAWYRFYAYLRPDRLAPGWSRDRVLEEMGALGLPCFSGSCSEIYRERAFVDQGLCPPNPLPVARDLGETSLALLVHPTLPSMEVTRVGEALRAVLERARR
jgi:dTDP-4-amino-4,6-dideoxygalactose transaminase